MRIALLPNQRVLGQGLELKSYFFPENGFVGIGWPLVAQLLSSPRFVHDPSTRTAPFQPAAGSLSPFEDPALHYGSTHRAHTPLLLEELLYRYSPSSSSSIWPQISFVRPSTIPLRPASTVSLPTPPLPTVEIMATYYHWAVMEMSETPPTTTTTHTATINQRVSHRVLRWVNPKCQPILQFSWLTSL